MSAQNQHYVPRFILRQFLCEKEREHVAVYDKHEDKTFVTAIKNIMTERRFHDFAVGNGQATFEPVATKIEQSVLPVYSKVLETRRLDRTPQSQAALALLMAFQFQRTKAHREMLTSCEDALRAKVEAMGGRMEDTEGWEAPTEHVRKREHLRGVVSSIDEFTRIIAHKDFLLAEAAADRSFYLGDQPVALYNRRTFGPYGNLGLAMPGIEIHMPLSADLLLCAWCPSILSDIAQRRGDMQAKCERNSLAELMAGRIDAKVMKACLEKIRPMFANVDGLLQSFKDGTPIASTPENMDHYNSLQVSFAYRYLIDKQSNFDLARRYNHEFPKYRMGHRLKFS